QAFLQVHRSPYKAVRKAIELLRANQQPQANDDIAMTLPSFGQVTSLAARPLLDAFERNALNVLGETPIANYRGIVETLSPHFLGGAAELLARRGPPEQDAGIHAAVSREPAIQDKPWALAIRSVRTYQEPLPDRSWQAITRYRRHEIELGVRSSDAISK